MKRLALTGSIAAGKSEVVKLLKAKAIPVFESDLAVHWLYEQDWLVAKLAQIFPHVVASGKIDRQRLSQHLIAHPQDFVRLEAVIHPEVQNLRDSFIAEQTAKGQALIVLDIPLLYEMGLENTVDATILVTAPDAVRQARAMQRPGMTEEKWQTISARQIPQSEKRQKADYILDNAAGLDDLAHNVAKLLAELIEHNSPIHEGR